MTSGVDPGSVADAGAYLARLLRLDPAAVVRLRPAGTAGVALWARLPFGPLVTRGLRATSGGGSDADVTVRASELLDALADGSPRLPRRCDAQWRWPLPPGLGSVVERIPVAEVRRLGAAAADALREAVADGVHGRPVGERMLRDALLDHVPIVVTTEGAAPVEVPQRLVQAVVRMGFLGPTGTPSSTVDGWVEVRVAGAWVGLAAAYGTAWHRPPGPLLVRPASG